MTNSAPAARSGGIVGVLAAAGIVASLMQTVVVPLVGRLPQMLHTSAANASWAITITLLMAAVTSPITGRLGDLYGERRLLLACTIPLTAGSVVCALADSLIPMVIGRGLQGMAMGMIPLGISLMREVLPPKRLGSAIALLNSSMGIGGALGLPLSALVTEHLSWRALFWGLGLLSAVLAVLLVLMVPATPGQGGGRLDYIGALGLGAALVCLLLGVSKGGEWGWGSSTTLGLLAAALAILPAWGWWELRCAEPLVDLRVTARRQVLLTNLVSILVGFAMYAQSLVMMQLLQLPTATGYGLGQSMLAAGLWLAPSGLMIMAVSSPGARLSAARGPKTTLAIGSLVLAVAYGTALALMSTAWGLMIASCVGMIGAGLAYGAMPALIISAVPRTDTAAANSFNSLMRSIGITLSAAVVGVVLSTMTVDFAGHVLPAEAGFQVSLWIGCGVAVLAALLSLALPARESVTGGHTPAHAVSHAGSTR